MTVDRKGEGWYFSVAGHRLQIVGALSFVIGLLSSVIE